MGSSLYLEISDQELERLVSETLSARLISARILTGGLFNTTYLLDICQKPGDISGGISGKEDAEGDSTERVVLRLGPVNRHLLMPFEHRLMEAETEVYALCETNGIPASQVLAVDTSKKLIDRDFMFVRYIPARPLSELYMEPDAMAAVCREIGEATAKFHTIRAPRFGRIVDVREGKGFDSWSEALNHELMEWEQVGVPVSIFEEAEYEKIRRIFRETAPYLDEIRIPRLVHTDLWFGNILVSTADGAPRLAAIIDADRALWGDPYFDFSSICWSHSSDSFWEGYGNQLPMDEASVIRRDVYTLLNRLWNTYVYFCEYNQPEDGCEEREKIRDLIRELEQLMAAGKGEGI